jgi:hypothetical protein
MCSAVGPCMCSAVGATDVSIDGMSSSVWQKHHPPMAPLGEVSVCPTDGNHGHG